jgi:hypothetical protein
VTLGRGDRFRAQLGSLPEIGRLAIPHALTDPTVETGAYTRHINRLGFRPTQPRRLPLAAASPSAAPTPPSSPVAALRARRLSRPVHVSVSAPLRTPPGPPPAREFVGISQVLIRSDLFLRKDPILMVKILHVVIGSQDFSC